MNSPRRVFGTLVVVLALGAAACGDDDKTQAGTSDTAPEAPTQDAFISAADEICAGTNSKSDEILGSIFSGEDPEPAAVKQGLDQVLDLIDGQLADVRALTPPKGDEARVDALWDEAEQTAGALRAKASTPEGTMEVINSEDDPFAALNEKLAAYGFADCAGESEPKTEVFGGDELSDDERDRATQVDVKGIEFSYEGVPASLPSGPAVFKFANAGAANHEIGLLRIKDGVPAAEAIAKAQADFDDESFVERFLGGVFALPGEEGILSVKLEPGLYGFACGVEDDSGTRHLNHGMIGTFTVAG